MLQSAHVGAALWLTDGKKPAWQLSLWASGRWLWHTAAANWQRNTSALQGTCFSRLSLTGSNWGLPSRRIATTSNYCRTCNNNRDGSEFRGGRVGAILRARVPLPPGDFLRLSLLHLRSVRQFRMNYRARKKVAEQLGKQKFPIRKRNLHTLAKRNQIGSLSLYKID